MSDCNGNGVLDVCDLAGGTNGDCNGDGSVNFGDIDPFTALLSG